jgi:hypothetical protein
MIIKRKRGSWYRLAVFVLLCGLLVFPPTESKALRAKKECCTACVVVYFSCLESCGGNPECEETCGKSYDDCIVPCEQNGDICLHRN